MNSSPYPDYDYVFGQLMLTLRNKIGLTQTALGDALGVSRRTIGSWESGRKYPNVDNLMVFIELAVEQKAFMAGREEDEIRSLWKLARQKVLLDETWLTNLLTDRKFIYPQNTQSIPIRYPLHTPPSTIINLPFQPTSFVGRTDELHEIASTLGDSACRLLTLIGPGGIGKTRLAIEIATNQQNNFSDGVVFVSLAPINAPNQIVTAICESLHLNFGGTADILEQLIRYLKQREMLLILDNFEHVLDGADIVNTITHQTNHLTILVTSRVRLDLRVEWLYDVEGLRYPAGDIGDSVVSHDDLSRYPAIQLFAQRALQIQPGFALSDTSLPTIVSLCQSVAGMPLGIELAVAGLRTHSVDAIEQQIQSNIASLTTTLRDIPSRHRSMRAVFDHSWNLLTQSERALFCKLSIFRGGCDMQACEQVIGATRSALQSLIDKSLLRQMNDEILAEERFYLLEPIREYALVKLFEYYDVKSINRAHAEYYLSLAESASRQWDTPHVANAIEVLNREHDNMRAALRRALDDGDIVIGLRLGGALWRFWRGNGNINEGRAWLDELLKQANDFASGDMAEVRLLAMNGAAWLASDQQDFDYAVALFEESLVLQRESGKSVDDTHLLLNAARQARITGHYSQARALLEDAMARLHEVDDRGSSGSAGLGLSIYELALVLRELGEFDRSQELYTTCVDFHREIGDQEGMHSALLGLGDIARDQGNVAGIVEYSQPCLEFYRNLGVQWAIGFAIHNLAYASYLNGDIQQASNLITECVALFRNLRDNGGLAEILVTQSHILRNQGNLDEAIASAKEALQLAWLVGPRLIVASTLEVCASIMPYTGQIMDAIQLLGVAKTLRTEMGTPIRPADQELWDRTLAMCRAKLGDPLFTQLWTEAQDIPLADLVLQLIGESSGEPISALDPVPPIDQNTGSPQSRVPQFDNVHLDWGDAISVSAFYGREWESNLLTKWLLEERCRVVSVLGLGGIGKSALAVHVMRQLADQFEVVIWRSLRDVPNCEVLLDDLVEVLIPQLFSEVSVNIDQKQTALLAYMRSTRILLVLDNVESILAEGDDTGTVIPGYESFERFLFKCAVTESQSCVLLTSREKLGVLIPHEAHQGPVRALRLTSLGRDACEQLLAERGIIGNATERVNLIEAYAGNPLALKIVSQTIVDLFGNELAPFLEQGEVIFGGIRVLLAEQFARLSALERTILLWLTILREPATLDELITVMVFTISRARMLEAMESLHRRSLTERGQTHGSFSLQSVVLEYATAHLITEICEEIESGDLHQLIEFGLGVSYASEYVRQIQDRLLVKPILEYLLGNFQQQRTLQSRLLELLDHLRSLAYAEQGYASANLLILLRLLQGHLRGLDLSNLSLRGLSLQGVEMQDSSLAGALLRDCILTETFDAIYCVAISPDGEFWAAASRQGEVRIWSNRGHDLYRSWRAHTNAVWTLSFRPGSHELATGSWDGTLRVWDISTNKLLWTGWHSGSEILRLAYSPNGKILASSAVNEIILWNAQDGTPLTTLVANVPVPGIAWSKQGDLLAGSDISGQIHIWSLQGQDTMRLLRTIDGGTQQPITSTAFSADSRYLAGACGDGTIRVYDVEMGQLLHIFEGHTDRVRRVAWSSDGKTIASGSRDRTIWLWDFEKRNFRAVLHGHTAEVWSIAFSPDSRYLYSGSEDGTLRVWDTGTGRCIRVLQSYAMSVFALDWSPDSRRLVSAGTDHQVTIWDMSSEIPANVINANTTIVCGIGWSPDGQYIATNEWTATIRLWNPTTGALLRTLRSQDDLGQFFFDVSWRPDSTQLASGTFNKGLQVFDLSTNKYHFTDKEFLNPIRNMAFSPDGLLLAGCGYDGMTYVCETNDFRLINILEGNGGMIRCLSWNADSRHLATGGNSAQGGEIYVWDVLNEEVIYSRTALEYAITALAWDANEALLITAGSDGVLRKWDMARGIQLWEYTAHQGTVQSLRRSPDKTKLASCGDDGAVVVCDIHTGEHLRTFRRDRPYERVDIHGIKGLTDAQKATLRSLGAIEQ